MLGKALIWGRIKRNQNWRFTLTVMGFYLVALALPSCSGGGSTGLPISTNKDQKSDRRGTPSGSAIPNPDDGSGSGNSGGRKNGTGSGSGSGKGDDDRVVFGKKEGEEEVDKNNGIIIVDGSSDCNDGGSGSGSGCGSGSEAPVDDNGLLSTPPNAGAAPYTVSNDDGDTDFCGSKTQFIIGFHYTHEDDDAYVTKLICADFGYTTAEWSKGDAKDNDLRLEDGWNEISMGDGFLVGVRRNEGKDDELSIDKLYYAPLKGPEDSFPYMLPDVKEVEFEDDDKEGSFSAICAAGHAVIGVKYEDNDKDRYIEGIKCAKLAFPKK